MTEFRLARLQRTVPIVESTGVATASFQRQYQTTLERIEQAVADLTTQISQISLSYIETTVSGDKLVLIVASGQTVTLPTAVGNAARFQFKLMVAGSLVIDAAGTETIDGAATATLTNQYESITLLSDNANWVIV